MAKFCGNCGSQQPDNARVCGNCGAPFAAPVQNGAPRQAPRPVNNNIDPAKKANLMKWGKLAAMALAAIVVIGLLIGIIGGGGSPKSVAKKFVNALEKGNEKKVMALLTDVYSKDAKEDYAEMAVEMFEYMFDDCKIKSIKVDDVEKMDKDDFKDYKDEAKDAWKEMKEEFDKEDFEDEGLNRKYNVNKMKGMATVTLEVTYKDEDGDKDEMEITVELIKEGASWKVMDFN